MSAPAVEASGVTKRFGGLCVVDDVSISVDPGEVRGIVGPNGAGKTTFLNLLSGLLRPNAGSIAYSGRDATKLPIESRTRLGVSRSFQINSLFESLTLRENLTVAAMARDRPRLGFLPRAGDGIGEHVERLAERFGIVDVIDETVESLPYGTQRSAELAVGCAAEPSVLLLDEPSSGLGLAERHELASQLSAITDSGVTLLMIEHDMDLVRGACESLTVLDRGRLIADGPIAEVMEDDEVNRVYLGQADE